MRGKLTLENGSVLEGISFGSQKSVAGEVVFTTGMVGYPESLTDPSYAGQILLFTYPLIGNYGVPSRSFWESTGIQTSGVIISHYSGNPSHHQSVMNLASWMEKEHIPGLIIPDTRLLAQNIRKEGTMLGRLEVGSKKTKWYDPNKENIVARVSATQCELHKVKQKRRAMIVLIDCGVKHSIIHSFTRRGCDVMVVPWNFNISELDQAPDGVVISNGPGDPKILKETIKNVSTLLETKIPVLGICLGNQILALAAGGDTYKLKYGHRSQNQPVKLHDGSNRYFLTTQNHGFAVGKVPPHFTTWFSNANDNTNEGIIHKKYPWMSVQFHPESCPGPTDTEWVFDEFISHITNT